MNNVEKVIEVALAEVGYLEKSKAAYKADPSVLYSKTAGAGCDNYTKYGKEMHDIYPSVMDFPAYWCDSYVDWCFQKSYGVSNAKGLLGGEFDDWTIASKALYVKKGAYDKNPKVGDQVFFKNSSGKVCHTGLVYAVDATYIYTVEGNTSSGSGVVANGGCVAKKRYLRTNPRIDGYGHPKYDILPATPTPVKAETKGNPNIFRGQQEAVKFTGINTISGKTFAIDGIRGNQTKKMAAMVLQTAINKDYGKTLKVDGDFGPVSKTALGAHYVKKGEVQYMVTAAEILLYLLGKNPNGVEYPGEFGSGLEKAAGVSKIPATMFMEFLR